MMLAIGLALMAFGVVAGVIAFTKLVSLRSVLRDLPPIPPLPRKPFDWFLWESEQIQQGGYAPWFDHWRYDGEPGAYLDPTPEQRAKVFRASLARARERYGDERLNDLVALAVERLAATGLSQEAAYDRVRHLGQDPVRLAIDIAEGRHDPRKGLH